VHSRIADLKVLNAFAESSAERVRTALSDDGFHVLTLDGSAIFDKTSFMARIPVDIQSPDGLTPRNWDGFSDILYQVVAKRPGTTTVLVWRHAEVMLERSFNEFLMALTVFCDVARSVSTTISGSSTPTRFRVVLLGDGPMFVADDDVR